MILGVVWMSWKAFACLCVIIVGLVLFLYGCNYYNVTIGWVGVYLVIGGLLVEIVLKAYAQKRLG